MTRSYHDGRLAILQYKLHDAPHTNEILHHEFVDRLRRVSHVHLALTVAKIRLLHDIGERRSMIQMKTAEEYIMFESQA